MWNNQTVQIWIPRWHKDGPIRDQGRHFLSISGASRLCWGSIFSVSFRGCISWFANCSTEWSLLFLHLRLGTSVGIGLVAMTFWWQRHKVASLAGVGFGWAFDITWQDWLGCDWFFGLVVWNRPWCFPWPGYKSWVAYSCFSGLRIITGLTKYIEA